MASWEFLKDGAGILPASNMADPLRGANLTGIDILVREAVQNSLDERRQDIDKPVRIRFERRVLTGDDKARFVDELRLDEYANRRNHFRASHSWFAKGNEVLDEMPDPDAGFSILMISDFNANGLGGRWNRRGSKSDRFFNLVLSIGGSLKWEGEDDGADPVRSLGSYGYGKMAFAMCSDIRTVLYYSTFHPDEGACGIRCRAMASGFLPQHSRKDIDFAGQAYFGDKSGEERSPRMPLVDEEAHAWMRVLGIPERSNEDTGTTVVIPAIDSAITMPMIVESCEKWWWPRMRDPDPVRRMEFEFVDEGTVVAGCNPRSRAELSPFIDCYKLIKSDKSGNGYEIKDVDVRPEGGLRRAGRLVLKALGSSDDGNENTNWFTNRVALVRDGLVIKYEDGFAHEDKLAVAGVFVPDTTPETLQAFVFSEPPSHDEWAEYGDRLCGRYTWGREFIRFTKNRLRNLTRDFQTRQAPAPDTERANAAAFLRKTLRQLFRPSTSKQDPPVPPVSRQRAFKINRIESGRRSHGSYQEDFAVFRVGLSDHALVESAMVDMTLSLKALGDADMRALDAVPCKVSIADGTHQGQDKVSFTAELCRNEEIEVTACGQVHPRWKTQWEISVVRHE